ncbi:hypothetical protein DTO021D3_6611 [Paecilomyces variotii]|nr:hypothetical protein DTO032I3_6096 [Paecilomyces variotii]KAJ9276544.1 hypothetical protein DTO021D3_6611 [Paecilomyces variotii]KAJ9345077.1 hypothetical protein DTO027B6_2222 [Paecilomyces variotii]KAJ9353012.1 hypothetical protein DTO027B9_5517 [Paecilomyces variotii]KAJ9390221.1 hypothetical protein DTO032I4_1747 [Paecilomyces variotii]
MFCYSSLFLSLATAVLASQPSASDPIPAPLRDLTWGQLNFLHTTDTHGWLAGHLQEPSFSADWGDYVSFATHMREKAEAQGWDLLVIDTGDRVEGNGLYDSSEPKGIYTAEILKQQHIDLLSSGNHELYKQNTSEAEFLTTVPNFRGNYLASNIDIYDPQTQQLVPLAPRYKKFTTKNQGIRIVAFGFLFDFTGNANNTVVQPVEETIKEDWFQEAIRDKDVDLFLVAGHVPVRSKEYLAIFKEIRSIRWDTPIQFFGGHWHIRDYVKYDAQAYGLASGRFMETVGFMSIDGLSTAANPSSKTPSFNRKYIDNNLFSYYHHTGLDADTFPTAHGQNVSRLIEESRRALHLDLVHGCAPKDLWMTRAKYPSEDSIYTWLEKEVLPGSVHDASRADKPALAIINTGAIRFDIFKGPFTQDDVYIVSPFTSGFRYVKDVPYNVAQKVVEVLNKQPQVFTEASANDVRRVPLTPPEQLAFAHDVQYEDFNAATSIDVGRAASQVPLSADSEPDLVPGYTTHDDAGNDGDDTVHSPISFYRVPNCIQAFVPGPSQGSSEPETVDLVYLDFIEPYVTIAAKFAGLDVDFKKDAEVYMAGKTLTSTVLSWIQKNWQCEQ